MNIGLHTDSFKMPNLALMKLARYHKLKGDTISIYQPVFANEYDKVYYSKIFNFSKTPFYIPNVEIGGSGYDITKQLPADIDNLEPDYSIYPDINYSVGFITRGCIRNCEWCVVPKKEGNIKPYRTIEQIARTDNDNLLLLDNNILASEFGLNEIDKLATTQHKVDFNQGLDARLVTPEVAKLLLQVKWIKYIRFSCDTYSMLPHIKRVYELLRSVGCKKPLFIYVLGVDFEKTYKTISEIKRISKSILVFMQPIKMIEHENTTSNLMKQLASWCNRTGYLKGMDFEKFLLLRNKEFLLKEM